MSDKTPGVVLVILGVLAFIFWDWTEVILGVFLVGMGVPALLGRLRIME